MSDLWLKDSGGEAVQEDETIRTIHWNALCKYQIIRSLQKNKLDSKFLQTAVHHSNPFTVSVDIKKGTMHDHNYIWPNPHVQNALFACGLRFEPVALDGNCFFSSIAQNLIIERDL